MEEVAPLEFDQMTCGCASKAEYAAHVCHAARKSWPHVLSPEGRGKVWAELTEIVLHAMEA